MEPRRSKHFLAHIPTIALLVLFAMSPWLGILFFILRAIDRDAEKKEQENAEYSSDFRPQDTGAGQTVRDSEPVYGHDVPTAEQRNTKKWHKSIATICTIMGAVFLFSGLTDAVDVISVWKFWPDPGELFSNIAMAIGGGGALLTGLRMKSTRKLERLLDKVVGERDTSPCRNCLLPPGWMLPGDVLPWSAPSTTAISGPMPISTTAPACWWCGALRPSRPDPPSPHPHRLPRISMPPCSASSGRPTMPSPTR